MGVVTDFSCSLLVTEGVGSPIGGGRGAVSIVIASEVPGTSTDVGVEAAMLAQVWSNGAVVVLFASLRFG
jgi:hypothetical protein